MPLDAATLDAYFARIGDAGPRAPTLATLNRLIASHVRAVTFENLDVLSGRGVSIALGEVVDKLVHARRGGYCFEQNGLFLAVLETLGFEVRPISARVRIQRPRDMVPPRTHLLLRVALPEGDHLADVGIGGLSPTAALRLERDLVQPTPHEDRRLVFEDGRWFHQARLGPAWADVCEFTLEEMPAIDQELANWYTATHPGSHFRNRLVVSRSGAAGVRYTVLNREFTVRGADGRAETEVIATPEALLALLDGQFGLRFPAGTRFPCAGLDFPGEARG